MLWWLLRTGEMAYCVKLLAQVESLLYWPVIFWVSLSVGSGDSWCHVSYYMQLKSHVIFPQGLISLGYTLDFPILLHYPPTVPRSLSEKTLKPDLGSLQVLSARGPSWGHAPWQQHRGGSHVWSCLDWVMGYCMNYLLFHLFNSLLLLRASVKRVLLGHSTEGLTG